jgi:hypothetical protein
MNDCVELAGKFYRWNDGTEEIETYTMSTVPVEECPAEAIEKLFNRFAQENRESREAVSGMADNVKKMSDICSELVEEKNAIYMEKAAMLKSGVLDKFSMANRASE